MIHPTLALSPINTPRKETTQRKEGKRKEGKRKGSKDNSHSEKVPAWVGGGWNLKAGC